MLWNYFVLYLLLWALGPKYFIFIVTWLNVTYLIIFAHGIAIVKGWYKSSKFYWVGCPIYWGYIYQFWSPQSLPNIDLTCFTHQWPPIFAQNLHSSAHSLKGRMFQLQSILTKQTYWLFQPWLIRYCNMKLMQLLSAFVFLLSSLKLL